MLRGQQKPEPGNGAAIQVKKPRMPQLEPRLNEFKKKITHFTFKMQFSRPRHGEGTGASPGEKRQTGARCEGV